MALDARLVTLYEEVDLVLRDYRSGQLPKAFKMLPAMRDWERLVSEVMRPAQWTAAGMLHATRLFASNLPAGRVTRFYRYILLPRVRDELAQFSKLNPYTFLALRKALYKPGAFFKGLVLPLCEVSCPALPLPPPY